MNIKNRKFKIKRLQLNLDGITTKIDNMVIQQRQIKAKLDTQTSKLSIEENGITLDDVVFKANSHNVWVGHFDNLENHVRLLEKDKYCEFNGNLYLVSDAIEHDMSTSYGRYEDLK